MVVGVEFQIHTFQPFTKVAIGFTKSPPEYIHNLFQAIACNLISQSFADGRSIRYPQVRISVTHHSTVNLFVGVVVPIPTFPLRRARVFTSVPEVLGTESTNGAVHQLPVGVSINALPAQAEYPDPFHAV